MLKEVKYSDVKQILEELMTNNENLKYYIKEIEEKSENEICEIDKYNLEIHYIKLSKYNEEILERKINSLDIKENSLTYIMIYNNYLVIFFDKDAYFEDNSNLEDWLKEKTIHFDYDIKNLYNQSFKYKYVYYKDYYNGVREEFY